jgi:methyl-accepting chemotaxis protein
MLLFVMSYMMLVIIFMAVFIFAPDFLQMNDPNVPIDVRAAVADRILYGHAVMWPALAILILLIGIHFFQVFHRFIGPMYRFRRAFSDIAAGDVSFQIQLRRKDFLNIERDEINRMLSAISERIGGAQSETAEVMMLVRQMGQTEGDESGSTPMSGDRLVELRERLARLSETLGYFKTAKEAEASEEITEKERETADSQA